MENSLFFHISGFFCILLTIVGMHYKSNQTFKKYMIVGTVLAAINMFFNGQYSGMLINIINFFRNLLSLNVDNIEKYKHQVTFVFVSLYVIVQIFLNDPYWFLPVLASTFGIVALFYSKGIYTRFILFLGTNIWLLYAILHGNYYVIVLEVILICSFISSFLVHKFKFEH